MNSLRYAQGIKSLAIMTAVCLIAGTASFADIKSPSSAWDKSVLSKNKGYTIEKKIMGDVSGDGKADTIYVLGKSDHPKSIYFEHFKIAVVDSSKGKLVQTTLPKEIDGGYDSNLILSNIKGSKANEIIITSVTGGSGGYINFAVYDYDGKALKSLLNSETSAKTTEITGIYKDQYKVDLQLKSLNKTFSLDVRDRKLSYDELKMYSNSKLVKPEKPEYAITPWGGGTVDLSFTKSSQPGLNNLILHTIAKGTCNADSLAEIQVTFQHNGQVFKPTGATIKQFYSEDTALLTKPIGEIKTLSVQKNGQSTALHLNAPSVTSVVKSLYNVKTQPIFFPIELERQESDPTHTLVVTFKDGTKETLMTTESGEFVYRLIDKNGSWTGGVYKGLSTQLNTALESTSTTVPATALTPSSKITKVNAESLRNEALEKVIITKLQIPNEYLSKTKYYYNYADLNQDGINEIIAVVMGPYTSGSGGSTALILTPIQNKLEVNQTLTLINTPIIISDKVTKGCKEIVVLRSGGGAKAEYVALTCSDGNYSTVNDGKVVDISTITGTSLMSNDLVKDMETGTFLTLSK